MDCVYCLCLRSLLFSAGQQNCKLCNLYSVISRDWHGLDLITGPQWILSSAKFCKKGEVREGLQHRNKSVNDRFQLFHFSSFMAQLYCWKLKLWYSNKLDQSAQLWKRFWQPVTAKVFLLVFSWNQTQSLLISFFAFSVLPFDGNLTPQVSQSVKAVSNKS